MECHALRTVFVAMLTAGVTFVGIRPGHSEPFDGSVVVEGDLAFDAGNGEVPLVGDAPYETEPADGFDACPGAGSCPGCGHCGDACDPPYGMINRLIDNKKACWTLRTEALLLWRNAPRSTPLVSTTAFPSTPAFDAHQLESTLAAGPRFSLFRTNGCGDALEATYFRAANFRAQGTLPTATGGYAPVFDPALTFDSASANLGSALQSFELNGRMTVAPVLQLMQGFRWFEWREDLQLVGTSAGIASTANTWCINSLYGYQLGFDALLYRGSWLRLEGLMKGGAYYNNVGVVTSVASSAASSTARLNTPKAASFLGEVGLTGVMPITGNLDFRVGYLGLWLEGIAQPTLQPPAATAVNTTGGAVLQGVTLGLEGRW